MNEWFVWMFYRWAWPPTSEVIGRTCWDGESPLFKQSGEQVSRSMLWSCEKTSRLGSLPRSSLSPVGRTRYITMGQLRHRVGPTRHLIAPSSVIPCARGYCKNWEESGVQYSDVDLRGWVLRRKAMPVYGLCWTVPKYSLWSLSQVEQKRDVYVIGKWGLTDEKRERPNKRLSMVAPPPPPAWGCAGWQGREWWGGWQVRLVLEDQFCA